jgi:NAD(P)-dependent dehydrogenase (short-subunit alcohol dehydrogenase family)
MSMNERRVVVITGGIRGIGFVSSQLLVREGFRVAVVDRTTNVSHAYASWLGENDGAVASFTADVTEPEAILDVFRSIAMRFGGIDALVNNAAISPKGPAGQKVTSWDINPGEWDEVFRVNVHGVVHCVRAAVPYLQARSEGSIVNIGSIMGICGASQGAEYVGFPASNSGAHYCASKAAIHNLTKSLARELAHYGIRVNCLAPGAVDSGMTNLPGTLVDRVKAQIPIGRLSTAVEIARGVLYLVDPERSPGLTGQVLNINGGWFM